VAQVEQVFFFRSEMLRMNAFDGVSGVVHAG
jgi:hypothetical protein